MRTIAKAILGAAMLVGTAAVFAAPASAGVSIGFGFGGPVYYGPRYVGPANCNPYSRWYDPYYCDDDYDYYYGPPLFIDGYWYDGPIRSRWYGGHREFWVHDGWRHGDFYHGGGRFEHRGGGEFHGGGGWGGHGGGSWGGRGGGSWGGHGGGGWHSGHH